MGKQQDGDDRSAGFDDHGSLARSRTAAATEYAGAGGSGIIDERPSHHYDRHHLHGAVGCIADDLQEDQRRLAHAFLITAASFNSRRPALVSRRARAERTSHSFMARMIGVVDHDASGTGPSRIIALSCNEPAATAPLWLPPQHIDNRWRGALTSAPRRKSIRCGIAATLFVYQGYTIPRRDTCLHMG